VVAVLGKGGGPFGAVVRLLRVLVTFVTACVRVGGRARKNRRKQKTQIERERSTKERRSSGSLQQSARTRTAAAVVA